MLAGGTAWAAGGSPEFDGARAGAGMPWLKLGGRAPIEAAGEGSPPGRPGEPLGIPGTAPTGTPATGVPPERMGVPHILQKFIPGGFTVRHAAQVFPGPGLTGTPAMGVGWRTRCAGGMTPA
jgi:hypothetical protein